MNNIANWVVGGLLVVVSLFTIGYVTGECRMKQRAVNSGVAEWTVSNRGNVGFRWNSRNKTVEDREQTK